MKKKGITTLFGLFYFLFVSVISFPLTASPHLSHNALCSLGGSWTKAVSKMPRQADVSKLAVLIYFASHVIVVVVVSAPLITAYHSPCKQLCCGILYSSITVLKLAWTRLTLALAKNRLPME